MRDALSRKIVDIEPSGIRKFFESIDTLISGLTLAVT